MNEVNAFNISCTPESGKLAAGASVEVTVAITLDFIGNFAVDIPCRIANGAPGGTTARITGDVRGPRVIVQECGGIFHSHFGALP